MLPKQINFFLASDHYPKLFWEPAHQGSTTLTLGKKHSATFPFFYHMGASESFTPAWIDAFPSCDLSSIGGLPRMMERSHFPDYDGWQRNVEKALAMIDGGHLQKVVLARKTILRFSSKLDPWTLFFRLRHNAALSTTRFCLQYAENRAFLGATPEKLFERTGLQLSTMALAGTSKCSSDSAKDGVLSSVLLASRKKQREVDCVRDFIANTLSSLSQKLEIGTLEILKGTHVQHLHYPIRALLKEGVSDEELLAALHPTPALGGLPRKEALAFIEKHEPFTREPYGTPIGFIGQKKTELAVAIRSASIEDRELHLFAGVGIVPGSDALEEWEELEDKISPFMGLL